MKKNKDVSQYNVTWIIENYYCEIDSKYNSKYSTKYAHKYICKYTSPLNNLRFLLEVIGFSTEIIKLPLNWNIVISEDFKLIRQTIVCN